MVWTSSCICVNRHALMRLPEKWRNEKPRLAKMLFPGAYTDGQGQSCGFDPADASYRPCSPQTRWVMALIRNLFFCSLHARQLFVRGPAKPAKPLGSLSRTGTTRISTSQSRSTNSQGFQHCSSAERHDHDLFGCRVMFLLHGQGKDHDHSGLECVNLGRPVRLGCISFKFGNSAWAN